MAQVDGGIFLLVGLVGLKVVGDARLHYWEVGSLIWLLVTQAS